MKPTVGLRSGKSGRAPVRGSRRLRVLLVAATALTASCDRSKTQPSGSTDGGDGWSELQEDDYRASRGPAAPASLLERIRTDVAQRGGESPAADAGADGGDATSISARTDFGPAVVACRGDRLATAGGATPNVWRVGDPTVTELEAHFDYRPVCAAWTDDGSQVVSVGRWTPSRGDPTTRVLRWDAATGRVVETRDLAPGWLGIHCAISLSAELLADSTDRSVTLWDLRSGAKLPAAIELGFSHDLAFSPDGQKLAVATIAGVQLYEVPGLRLLAKSEEHFSAAHRYVLWSSTSPPLTAWSDPGQTVLETWGEDATLKQRVAFPEAAGRLLAVQGTTLLFANGWAEVSGGKVGWSSHPFGHARGGCFLGKRRIVARVGYSPRITLGRIGSDRELELLFVAKAPLAIRGEVVDANDAQLNALTVKRAQPPYEELDAGTLTRDPELLEKWLSEGAP